MGLTSKAHNTSTALIGSDGIWRSQRRARISSMYSCGTPSGRSECRRGSLSSLLLPAALSRATVFPQRRLIFSDFGCLADGSSVAAFSAASFLATASTDLFAFTFLSCCYRNSIHGMTSMPYCSKTLRWTLYMFLASFAKQPLRWQEIEYDADWHDSAYLTHPQLTPFSRGFRERGVAMCSQHGAQQPTWS